MSAQRRFTNGRHSDRHGGRNCDEMVAESLDEISNQFKISKVIVFDANHEELVRRILHRGETSGRSDDTEESISVRLKVYELDTAPLIDHYKQKNLVVNINAIGEVDNIYNLISGEF